MTRAVVLADTHLPRRGRGLPRAVLDALQQTDLILHLGDFTDEDVVRMLESFAPLYAVHGNNDSEEVRSRFPAVRQVTINGHHLTLLHGHLGGRTALAAARAAPGAVVLFGHSHQPYLRREDGKLLFNPGSPTERRRAPQRSFGVLDIDERISPLLIDLP